MSISPSPPPQPNMSDLAESNKRWSEKNLDAVAEGSSKDLQRLFSCILFLDDNDAVGEKLRGSRLARISYYYWPLMVISVAALLVGGSVAWLLGRLYFLHGGSRRWLYASLQSMGWPILLLPLALSYCPQSITITPFTIKTVFLFILMGGISTLDNLLYSWGQSNLPVSTDSLLCSSQLAFSALLAWVLLKQKMSHYMLNAFVLITISAVVLTMHPNSHDATMEKKFVIGCIVTVAASGLYALMLAMLELIYVKVVCSKSFRVVLEIQIIISMASTFFSMLGMWISGEFSGLQQEAAQFGLGTGIYLATLLGSAVGWQLYIVGGAGIIFLASSLMSCVFMTAMLPLVPVLAVFFFHDSITTEKLIALFLALWGFSSYIYGAYDATIIQDHTGNIDNNKNKVSPGSNNAES